MPLAVPELVVMVVGLLCLLIYLAFTQLKNLLSTIMNNWGTLARIVGGPIDHAIEAAFNAIKGWLEAGIHGITDLFHGPAAATDAHTKANVSAHVHHQQYADWISGTHLITMENDTRALARSLVADEHNYSVAVASELHTFEGTVADWTRQLVSYVNGTVADTIRTDVNPVRAEADALLSELHIFEGTVEQWVGQLHGYVDNVAQNTIDVADGRAKGFVDALSGDITGTIAGVIPGAGVGIQQVLRTVAVDAATAADFVRTCGEPMCDWWHQAGNELSSILGAIEITAFLALMGSAIANPAGTADEVAGIADDLWNLGSSVLQAMVPEAGGQ